MVAEPILASRLQSPTAGQITAPTSVPTTVVSAARPLLQVKSAPMVHVNPGGTVEYVARGGDTARAGSFGECGRGGLPGGRYADSGSSTRGTATTASAPEARCSAAASTPATDVPTSSLRSILLTAAEIPVAYL